MSGKRVRVAHRIGSATSTGATSSHQVVRSKGCTDDMPKATRHSKLSADKCFNAEFRISMDCSCSGCASCALLIQRGKHGLAVCLIIVGCADYFEGMTVGNCIVVSPFSQTAPPQ
ncbi:hypothetical protein D3C78_1422970 [compost metagenome]